MTHFFASARRPGPGPQQPAAGARWLGLLLMALAAGLLPGRAMAQAVTAPAQACAGAAFSVTVAPLLSGQNPTAQAIPDADDAGIGSAIVLSGAPGGAVVGSGTVLRVTLNVSHTYDQDLRFFLVGPGNAGALELSINSGGSGNDYTNTVLLTTAPNIIGSTGNNTAPFTGTYRPRGTPATAIASAYVSQHGLPAAPLTGSALNGTWTLRVFDSASGDPGRLLGWSLELSDPAVSGAVPVLSGPGTVGAATASGSDYVFEVRDAPVGRNAYVATRNGAAAGRAVVQVLTASRAQTATAPARACLGTAATVAVTVPPGSTAGENLTPQAIPDNNNTGISSAIVLSGAAAGTVVGSNTVLRVTLNIAHTFDGDLRLFLVGPGNAGTLELSTASGGSGNDYTNTVLLTTSPNIIGSAGNNTAPFSGTYRPEGTTATAVNSSFVSLHALPAAALTGTALNGTWTLRAFDISAGDVGTLQNWSLELTDPAIANTAVGSTTLSGPGTIGAPVVAGNVRTFTVTNFRSGPNAYTAATPYLTATGCNPANATAAIEGTNATAWTGAAGTTDWYTAGNWDTCVPMATINAAVVPVNGGGPYPQITGGTADVRSLALGGSATLDLVGGTLRVSNGNLTLGGGFAHSAGTVVLQGPSDQSIATVNPLRSVSITSTGTTMLATPLTITQGLTFGGGLLRTNGNLLTLSPGATLSEYLEGYVLGQVQATATVAADGVARTFGNIGLALTAPSGTVAPGATTVTRTTGTRLANPNRPANQSIPRYFDVQPATNTGLRATLAFTYSLNDLNGIPIDRLTMYRATGTGGPFQAIASTTSGTTLTATNVDHFSVWTLADAAAPLPVELRDFTATAVGPAAGPAAVRLAWATASEQNSAAFEVERSGDGEAFERIGTVAAAGSSSTARSYELMDAQLPVGAARLYYRLRQVDADGSFSYSPVRTVALTGAAEGLSLYPNPAVGGAATLTGTVPGAVVTVTDALGRPVATATADASGAAALKMPAGLPAGLYVVRAGGKALRLTVE
ncbi:proprotein convertase P-domain-containing protein [Hymenobacter cyanobacteriorum]|uniref:proprotein convertase P-domain-containing protein n=1 Tax=Hymenobacter cyanobacteriorum TaxID=2926463 RepID=UPI002410D77B|nr:proprotein convertase P-domain-containing protein [Hymenobacter cyanobacteriorum]